MNPLRNRRVKSRAPRTSFNQDISTTALGERAGQLPRGSMATCANTGGREAGHQNMKLDAGNNTGGAFAPRWVEPAHAP